MAQQPTCEELIDGILAKELAFYKMDKCEALLEEGYELRDNPDYIDEQYDQMILCSILCIDRKFCGEIVEDFTVEEMEAVLDEMEELPEVETRVVTVLMSFGGPSSGYDFHVDSVGNVKKCEFWYHDWFDGARRELSKSDTELLAGIFGVERGVSHNFS